MQEQRALGGVQMAEGAMEVTAGVTSIPYHILALTTSKTVAVATMIFNDLSSGLFSLSYVFKEILLLLIKQHNVVFMRIFSGKKFLIKQRKYLFMGLVLYISHYK